MSAKLEEVVVNTNRRDPEQGLKHSCNNALCLIAWRNVVSRQTRSRMCLDTCCFDAWLSFGLLVLGLYRFLATQSFSEIHGRNSKLRYRFQRPCATKHFDHFFRRDR